MIGTNVPLQTQFKESGIFLLFIVLVFVSILLLFFFVCFFHLFGKVRLFILISNTRPHPKPFVCGSNNNNTLIATTTLNMNTS